MPLTALTTLKSKAMYKYGFKLFWSDEDAAYIVTCPELPGLSAFGDTEEDALREAKIALGLFIEDMRESGEPLPVPQAAHSYSGQFRVRLPRTLHRQLAERAEEEGVSLNSLVMTYLSGSLVTALSTGLTSAPVDSSHVIAPSQPELAHSSMHFEQSVVDDYAREVINRLYRVSENADEAANNQDLALAA